MTIQKSKKIKYRVNAWNGDGNQSFPLLCECPDKWILNFLCRVLKSPIVSGMASAFSSKQGVLNHLPLPKWSLSEKELWLSLFKLFFLCHYAPGNHHNCSEESSEVSSLIHTSTKKLLTWLVCLQNCDWDPAMFYLEGVRYTACIDGLQCDPQT